MRYGKGEIKVVRERTNPYIIRIKAQRRRENKFRKRRRGNAE